MFAARENGGGMESEAVDRSSGKKIRKPPNEAQRFGCCGLDEQREHTVQGEFRGIASSMLQRAALELHYAKIASAFHFPTRISSRTALDGNNSRLRVQIL